LVGRKFAGSNQQPTLQPLAANFKKVSQLKPSPKNFLGTITAVPNYHVQQKITHGKRVIDTTKSFSPLPYAGIIQ